MNGRIRRRGADSWEITVDLGNDAQGRRLRKFFTVRGKRSDADRKLREVMAALDRGLPVDTSKITVAEFMERWLKDYATPHTRPRTAESYRVIARVHIVPHIGQLPLQKLQPADIQRMEAAILASGRSANTVQHVHRTLSQALKHAVKWGLLWRNPAQAVDAPRFARRETQVPDVAAVNAVLRMADATEYGAVLSFLAYTGCRRAEALGLRWQDVDMERGAASIVQTLHRVNGQGIVVLPPKSAKGRRAIALDQHTVALLRRHRTAQAERRLRLGDVYQNNGLVFAGPLGKPLDPATLTHVWQRVARKSGLSGVRLHDLRHFHATMLLSQGVHPKVVQERLGHATISITLDTYSHVVPGMQEAAAEAFAQAMNGVAVRRSV